MNQYYRLLLPLLIITVLSCNDNGLKPVSGVEGAVFFHDAWPDSVNGALIVALDEGAISDPEHPEDWLISYSGAIPKGTDIQPYFIQLEPGAYYLGLLGLTVEPSFFVTKLDSFLGTEHIPIFLITNPFEGITVWEKETIRNKDWNIYFNGESQ